MWLCTTTCKGTIALEMPYSVPTLGSVRDGTVEARVVGKAMMYEPGFSAGSEMSRVTMSKKKMFCILTCSKYLSMRPFTSRLRTISKPILKSLQVSPTGRQDQQSPVRREKRASIAPTSTIHLPTPIISLASIIWSVSPIYRLLTVGGDRVRLEARGRCRKRGQAWRWSGWRARR